MKRQREIVALILLPLLYFYIVELSPLYFFFLIAIISTIAQSEFYSMYRVGRIYHLYGIMAGLLVLVLFHIESEELPSFLILSFLAVVMIRLFHTKRTPENALSDIAPVVVGFLYVPVILGLQIAIRKTGPEWVILTCGTVWASDSSAYYVGKNFGKKKLYRTVSPKKTIVGAVGSLAGGALSCLVIAFVLIDSLTVVQALLFGSAIGAITVVGDLSESMFKRDAEVKDSSHLIPGHGGILDKMDGILFATPAVYLLVRLAVP